MESFTFDEFKCKQSHVAVILGSAGPGSTDRGADGAQRPALERSRLGVVTQRDRLCFVFASCAEL